MSSVYLKPWEMEYWHTAERKRGCDCAMKIGPKKAVDESDPVRPSPDGKGFIGGGVSVTPVEHEPTCNLFRSAGLTAQ